MRGWRILLILAVVVLAGCTLPFGGTGDDAGNETAIEQTDDAATDHTDVDDGGESDAEGQDGDDDDRKADASFAITDFGPGDVTITRADEITVTATVENTGDVEGTQSVVLTRDGINVQHPQITLAGGETRNLTFALDAADLAGEYNYGLETRDDRVGATLTAEPLTEDERARLGAYQDYAERIADGINDTSEEITFSGRHTTHSVSSVSASVREEESVTVTMEYEDGYETHQSAALAALVLSEHANLIWQDKEFDEGEDPDDYLPELVEVRFYDPEYEQVRLNYTVDTDSAVSYYRGDVDPNDFANKTIGDYDVQLSNESLIDPHLLLINAQLYHGAHLYETHITQLSVYDDNDTTITTHAQRDTIQVYVTWDEEMDLPVTIGRTMILEHNARFIKHAAPVHYPYGGFDFYIRNEANEPEDIDILGNVGAYSLGEYLKSEQTNDDLIELVEAANLSQLEPDEQSESPFGIET